jgi:opacity protein-like surface antigen
MTKLGLALFLAALTASSAMAADLTVEPAAEPTAPANPEGGFYASFFGGAALVNDLDYEASTNVEGSTSFDNGFDVNGAVGYAFGNGLSLEAQLGYQRSDQTGGTYGPYDVPVTGTGSVLYGMVNAWYGVDLGNITPFVGGGVGVASMTLDSVYTGAMFEDSTFKDSDATWAAQIGAGLAVAVTEDIDLVGRYRYFTTGDVSFVDGQGTTLTAGYGAHLVDVGLKLAF